MSAGDVAPRAVNSAPRAVRAATTEHDQSRSGLLEQARDVALWMLTADGRQATALRVRVGDVLLEMEWPNQGSTQLPLASVGQQAAHLEPDQDGEPSGGYLTAHTVGAFYGRPSPDAEPFVTDGDVVYAGQQVAIIEAMKLMLPVEADRDCRIGAVLAEDGQSVEFGDRLFACESLDAAGRNEK